MSLAYPRFNICKRTDSYKVSHWRQYPPDAEIAYDYLESRGGEFSHTIYYGAQRIVKAYLTGQVVTQEKIDEAAERWAKHFSDPTIFNKAGWQYILDQHGGKLPLEIRTAPEGILLPTGNIMLSVENTDPQCAWLPGWIEPIIMKVWYATTVATLSWHIKQLIGRYLDETGAIGSLDWKLHDFGYRGGASEESTEVAASAHLINFFGTDTGPGIEVIEDYYNGASGIIDGSIAAAEHSTIGAWGGPEAELAAFEHILGEFPDGILAVVSDTYNIYNACSNLWGEKLRDKVLNRNGTLVVRPDSGKPSEMVLDVIERLGEKFPVSVNPKGYKVLDSHIRAIQGDGLNYKSIMEILEVLLRNKWSADNIAFGMGGALHSKVDRDTQKFAIKLSALRRAGIWYDVYKDPISDKGKRSKRGRLSLTVDANGEYRTIPFDADKDIMKTLSLNGDIVEEINFDEIRANAAKAAAKWKSSH